MPTIHEYEKTLREMVSTLNLSITSPKEKPREKELGDFRIISAAKIMSELETGNTAFVADTGTGKTIVSFLIFLFLHRNEKKRTLFLVPQVVLAGQHNVLLNGVAKEHSPSSLIITGATKQKNRDWKSPSIIFATPQTFFKEYSKGTAKINDFHFVVFDEFHRGQGKYDYVPIANLFKENNVPILLLSASPGGNKEKIAKVKNTFGIKHWVRGMVAMPEKEENILIVKPDETLENIDKHFLSMFRSAENQLVALKLLKNNFSSKETQIEMFALPEIEAKPQILPIKKLEEIKDEIFKLPTRKRYEAFSIYGIYMKLRYAYGTCMTEGYETFLYYIGKLKEKDRKDQIKSKGELKTTTHRFLTHPRMESVIQLAEDNRDYHPKVQKLISLIRFFTNRRGLIFVGEKETGLCLNRRLSKFGISTEVLFGGRGKSIKHQNHVISSLMNGTLNFAVSTSVVKEGLNIPEMDVVVHYSLSKTGIELIQGNGRIGRTYPGKIYFIVLDHFLDRSMYWSTKRQVQTMNRIVGSKNIYEPTFSFI